MQTPNESGYELWLRYRRVDDAERLAQYRAAINSVVVLGTNATAAIIKNELARALPALLDRAVPITDKPVGNVLIVGMVDELKTIGISISQNDLDNDGFIIASTTNQSPRSASNLQSPTSTIIAANSASAVLTGTFHFLRLLQTHQDIRALDIVSRPRIRQRILTHWDNLDGTIERGYAGRSLWNWDELPNKIDARYHDYARACVHRHQRRVPDERECKHPRTHLRIPTKNRRARQCVSPLWDSCLSIAKILRADPTGWINHERSARPRCCRVVEAKGG